MSGGGKHEKFSKVTNSSTAEDMNNSSVERKSPHAHMKLLVLLPLLAISSSYDKVIVNVM